MQTARTLRFSYAHPRTPSFTRRVQMLIDTYFPMDREDGPAGNVSEAARALGMTQRALAKMYSGDVTNPTHDSLVALIEGFPEEDPIWIMTGEMMRESAIPRRVALRIVKRITASMKPIPTRRRKTRVLPIHQHELPLPG